MKLVIDFNEPELKRQLELAVNEHARKIVAEEINKIIHEIIDVKFERVQPAKIQQLCTERIDQWIKNSFTAPMYGQSDYQKILAQQTEKLLREKLTPSK